MSKKKKSSKKKIVVTPKQQTGKRVVTNQQETKKQSKLAPTTSKMRASASTAGAKGGVEFIFDKKNYYFMLGGIALMALGFILMLGGNMPSPDVWEPERIYSFRRVTLAPMLILAGLGLEVYAIFKKY